MDQLVISEASSHNTITWHVNSYNWEGIVKMLSNVRRTNETMEQYDAMSKTEQSKVKDGACFVGGEVVNNSRKSGEIQARSLITLDADHVKGSQRITDFFNSVERTLDGLNYIIYSTHSNRHESGKYRVIIPLDRIANPVEYEASARKVAYEIGLDYFDRSTFQPERLMYKPSCSSDAVPFFESVTTGESLNLDTWLAKYVDYKNVLEWHVHPRTDKSALQRKTLGKKAENPLNKKNSVGAFCNSYTIPAAIETFLQDVYEPTQGTADRYTFTGGSTSGGFVVYDDEIFAYSHHKSDPCFEQLVNAFDLVRIHLFGDLDNDSHEKTPIHKRPSYVAMKREIVDKDELCKGYFIEEKEAEWQAMMEDDESYTVNPLVKIDNSWKKKMMMQDGKYIDNSYNLRLAMSKGAMEGVLSMDEFYNVVMVMKQPPWKTKKGRKFPDRWSNQDASQLHVYLTEHFGIGRSAEIRHDMMIDVALNNGFNPVIEYVESEEWDGIKRAETVLIDYLGAEDDHYTRQVTRKTLLAAAYRLYDIEMDYQECIVLSSNNRQGVGKSSFIKKLAFGHSTHDMEKLTGKEAVEQAQSGFIHEIPELVPFQGMSAEQIKRFFSIVEDNMRPAYGRVTEKFKRRCIYIGTTNKYHFLKDATGNRRFYPVEVVPERAKYNHWVDLRMEKADDIGHKIMRQIWAEVLVWMRTLDDKGYHESLVLDTEAAAMALKHQNDRMHKSTDAGLIEEWLDIPAYPVASKEGEEEELFNEEKEIWQVVSVPLILERCLDQPYKNQPQRVVNPIHKIMASLDGWELETDSSGKPKRTVHGKYGKQQKYIRVKK